MSGRNTCGLCGLPISPDVDLEDDDGQHYHRVCNVVSASTLYRSALTRIAELEALSNTSVCIFCGETMEKDLTVMLDHAKGCGERPENRLMARIAELEAENLKLKDEVGDEWARAEQAEAKRDELLGQREGWYQVCAKLEAERDALRLARLPCREAEVAQRRYEQAEAELAAVGSDLQDEAEYNITLRERAEQAEAELAERDRMLRIAHKTAGGPERSMSYELWLADLRVRAEEGSGA